MIIIIPIGPRHRLRVRRIGVSPGTCRVCIRTQERGCAVGCAWADAACTLCSRCAHNAAVVALALRKARQA